MKPHPGPLAAVLATALVITGLLPPASAAAQAGPPPERYAEALQPRPAVPGLSAAESRELNDVVDRLAAVLRASPAIRTAPDGFCTRLGSFIEETVAERGRASVDLQFPVIVGGRCTDVLVGGVAVDVNMASRLLGSPLRLDGVPEDGGDGGGPMHAMPRPLPARGGHPAYEVGPAVGRHAVVLTRRTEPLFLPVTRARFLGLLERSLEHSLAETERSHAENAAAVRKMAETVPALAERLPEMLAAGERAVTELREWVERVRQARTTLPTDALAAQACYTLLVDEAVAPTAACANGDRLVTANPRFFDPGISKGAAQLLIVRTASRRAVAVSESSFRKAREIFDAMDLQALAAVLR